MSVAVLTEDEDTSEEGSGELPTISLLSNITAYTGQNITIDFQITGQPKPSVKW